MKRETEQIIQQTLENVVGYIDQLPNGEFISSEWQPPKGFKNERFKVNKIIIYHYQKQLLLFHLGVMQQMIFHQ